VIDQWYTDMEANCDGSTCSVPSPQALSDAEQYTWWILPWNAVGDGPWSASLTFTVNTSYCPPQPTEVPGAATLITPSWCTTETTPTLTWEETANASQYKVFLRTSGGTTVLNQWYSWFAVNCDGSTCSMTTPALAEDDYLWWVLTASDYGSGPWSSPLNFEVAASCPPEMIGRADVIFRKRGSGSGTIRVGTQECGPDCDELPVPYADYALLTVIAAEGSHFVRLEREDGTLLNVDSFAVSPGETVFVIFEQNE
jgi:hypothetical protein